MADEADQTYGHLTKIIRVIDVMLNYQGGAEIRHSFVQATFSQIGLANIPLAEIRDIFKEYVVAIQGEYTSVVQQIGALEHAVDEHRQEDSKSATNRAVSHLLQPSGPGMDISARQQVVEKYVAATKDAAKRVPYKHARLIEMNDSLNAIFKDVKQTMIDFELFKERLLEATKGPTMQTDAKALLDMLGANQESLTKSSSTLATITRQLSEIKILFTIQVDGASDADITAALEEIPGDTTSGSNSALQILEEAESGNEDGDDEPGGGVLLLTDVTDDPKTKTAEPELERATTPELPVQNSKPAGRVYQMMVAVLESLNKLDTSIQARAADVATRIELISATILDVQAAGDSLADEMKAFRKLCIALSNTVVHFSIGLEKDVPDSQLDDLGKQVSKIKLDCTSLENRDKYNPGKQDLANRQRIQQLQEQVAALTQERDAALAEVEQLRLVASMQDQD